MQKIKRIAMYMVAAFLLVVAFISLTPENTYAAGKYEYEVYGDKILKINLQNGKVKKTKIKSAKKIANTDHYYPTIEHKKYLYFTSNAHMGTCCIWNYVCRVKKDGSGFQVLGKGNNPQIVGNWIYYTKESFKEKCCADNKKIDGVYKMKLNGAKKTKVLGDYALLCVYKDKLYVTTRTEANKNVIVKYSMDGKENQIIVDDADGYYGFSWNKVWLSDGMLYYDSSDFHEKTYEYTSINLKNDTVNYHTSKGIFAGIDKTYLYYYQRNVVSTGKIRNTMYYQKKNSAKVKKFSKEICSPIICSNSNKPYVVAQVGRGNYPGSNMVVFNLKKKKVKTIAGWNP